MAKWAKIKVSNARLLFAQGGLGDMGGAETSPAKTGPRPGNFQQILFADFRATGSHKTDLERWIGILAAPALRGGKWR